MLESYHTIHAVIEVHGRLQEENIPISHQALMYTQEGALLLYISFQNHNIQAGTGNFIYNSILLLKQDGL